MALQLYERSACQGNVSAQNQLGCIYFKGAVGVPKDFSTAFYWYKKAAEKNDAKSQYDLGHCYAKGLGVKQNMTHAISWYKKAAELGYSAAKVRLAKIYEYGRGVDIDQTQAEYWYGQVSKQLLSEYQWRLTQKELGQGEEQGCSVT